MEPGECKSLHMMRSSTLLALDFDETITLTDTTQLIVDLAINSIEDPCLREEYQRHWNLYANEYYCKLKQLLQELIETRKTCNEFTIVEACRKISQFERESVAQTSAKRFLKGVRRRDLVDIATSIGIHSPALEILEHAEQRGFQVGIISLSWSRDMITACIGSHRLDHYITICSNDLEFDCNEVSTGKIQASLFCGVEKVDQLHRLKQVKKPDQIVFIGDSLGDILPMLESNIGILFNPSANTLNFCNIFDIPIQPLSELLEAWRRDDCESTEEDRRCITDYKGNIFTTDSWNTIQSFLDVL